MTDNEIIKALECCKFQTKTHCFECPIFSWSDCHALVVRNALDLINRQKAEIERLQKHIKEGIVLARQLPELASAIRSEAIKEFADRLKENLIEESYDDCQFFKVVGENEIDNLLKEMTEGQI